MKIEIYTVDYCPFCKKALEFLRNSNVEFNQIRIDDDENGWFKKLSVMLNKNLNDVTVPQIIVDGTAIGGYSDMMALHEQGKLPFG